MPIPQGKKKEGKREGNKGRRTTRKNHMGSRHRGEVQREDKLRNSLENSEKKTENSLHKTLQDRQANRCRLRERLKGVIKKGVKVFFMDESGIRHDPSRVRRLGLYVVRVDYPSVKVNVLACIPLFDGKPCFMLTMLILGFSLIFFTCLGLGILVMSC